MAVEVVSVKPGINHRMGRHKSKVKTGCKTCKIRKVKCDEKFPVCHRCVSTGRVCDGYGIWGGGGNQYGSQLPLSNTSGNRMVIKPPSSKGFMVLDTEEARYFEWFGHRTAVKLPGSFASSFWDALLFQASQHEPAVLHAVLALSATHKKGVTGASNQGRLSKILDDQERFTLQHYVQAISHLRSHFDAKNAASFRICLITCVIFVCLELLRGHFETAGNHLQKGLQILEETQYFTKGHDGLLHLKASLDSTDEWIVEAFSRLHLQFELFKRTSNPHLFLSTTAPSHQPEEFASFKEAWQHLDRIINSIFQLNHTLRASRSSTSSASESLRTRLATLSQHSRIDSSLSWWLATYETSSFTIQQHWPTEFDKVRSLLYSYHSMASIMLTASLSTSELIYDSQTSLFLRLLQQCIDLRSISGPKVESNKTEEDYEDVKIDMAHSIIDMGWISPLFYLATKCRISRVRNHAVRLLETTGHREGIWDSGVAGTVMRKVTEIEEGGWDGRWDRNDGFDVYTCPSLEDVVALEILPEERRLRELEVVLSGAPLDRITLFCKQNRKGVEGGEARVLIATYDVKAERWVG